jgi:hypothetical protein
MQRGFDGAFAQNGRCQKTIALGPLGFIGAGVIGRDWLGYGSTVALTAALVSASTTTWLLEAGVTIGFGESLPALK